jgi:hypothetical protein
MKIKQLAQVFTALVLLCISAFANAVVLTMDRNEACGSVTCGNFTLIDQGYGDAAGVDVTWGTSANTIAHWDNFYSDLTDVVFANPGPGSQAQIDIAATNGSMITLNGFDLGSWPNVDGSTSWSIFELGGSLLLDSSGPITVNGLFHTSIDVAFSSFSGFRILWGPDAWNVGLDNLDFDVDVDVTAVPEPGTLGLLGLGLLGLAVARRKRTL